MPPRDTLNYAEASTRWGGMLARVAAALCLYPLILVASLYATWFMAWAELGHRPVPSLDDPKSISRVVDVPYFASGALLVGMFAALGLHVAVLVAMAVHCWRQRRPPNPRGVVLGVEEQDRAGP